MGNEALQYAPKEVTPPGATVLDALGERGMTQADLAERTGHSRKMINEIIKGLAPITAETAIQLERVFGIPASFWNKREQHHREFLARKAEAERLKGFAGWLKDIPVAEMAKRGWIPKLTDKVERLRAVLNFFGVASPDQWEAVWRGPEAAFRKSAAFDSKPGAVAAWLRKGELEAAAVHCSPYDATRFREALGEARSLTREPLEAAFPRLQSLCASAGVSVVLILGISGSRASGATRWLTSEKALIQLSLRYKMDDQFWFTFFHEAGHVLLHGKRRLFVELDGEKDAMEREADDFAQSMLIHSADWAAFTSRRGKYFSQADVEGFAQEQGIAPGIVAGRLQHERLIPSRNLNGLKRPLAWPESEAL